MNSISLRNRPHAFGRRKRPSANRLFHFQSFDMVVMKKVIKPATLRFVQKRALIDARPGVRVLRLGLRGGNLVEAATGPALRRLRAVANGGPFIAGDLLAGRLFGQQNGARRVAHDRGFVTGRIPVRS